MRHRCAPSYTTVPLKFGGTSGLSARITLLKRQMLFTFELQSQKLVPHEGLEPSFLIPETSVLPIAPTGNRNLYVLRSEPSINFDPQPAPSIPSRQSRDFRVSSETSKT